VGTAQIALGAITAALIENGAIGTAQIADASITDAKIVELSQTASPRRAVRRAAHHTRHGAVANLRHQQHGELVSTQVDTIDGYVLTERTITARQDCRALHYGG
jgi:hypothetical protein